MSDRTLNPNGHPEPEGAAEGRTTPVEQPSCVRCGGSLTGRKTRFCSDACRMQDQRKQLRAHRLSLLNTITDLVEELRTELGDAND